MSDSTKVLLTNVEKFETLATLTGAVVRVLNER
jgi:hypothetical protein